jgi:hypothetical protein
VQATCNLKNPAIQGLLTPKVSDSFQKVFLPLLHEQMIERKITFPGPQAMSTSEAMSG